ncbi:MAG: energy transducer TonB [Terracidiphilus sp.]
MPRSTDYYSPAPQLTFGLLPEGEGRRTSFIISSTVNTIILVTLIAVGMMAKQVIQKHYEMTELIVPNTPPPQHFKQPPPPKMKPIEQPRIEMQPRVKQIEMPKPKPEPKPVQLQAKVNLPEIAKPQMIRLAPQPKAALAAAMPAQNNSVKPSTAPVHLGQTFGATPNPNATRPATIAAIGNPYGGMNGPAVAPHGVVGSTGIGNSTKAGSNNGQIGKVGSAGIPGATGTANRGSYGTVASAGIPTTTAQVASPLRQTAAPQTTDLEVIYKPPVQYTPEARQMKIEGDVVLRVTFLASGRVVVQGVVRGLGHGLDQEAQRVAQQIRFRPATRDGRPVDLTTTITISFQLA